MIATRTIVVVFAVLGMAAGPSLAQGRGGGGAYHGGGGHSHGGYHGGGGYRGGYYPYWGWGLGLGIGIGLANSYWWNAPYYGYSYGPPVYYEYSVPANPGYTVTTAPPPPAPPASTAEPIFYPRNGQSDAQRETDVRECNRWATTQPAAMADASVFQRAVFACMDGRGYTGR